MLIQSSMIRNAILGRLVLVEATRKIAGIYSTYNLPNQASIVHILVPSEY